MQKPFSRSKQGFAFAFLSVISAGNLLFLWSERDNGGFPSVAHSAKGGTDKSAFAIS